MGNRSGGEREVYGEAGGGDKVQRRGENQRRDDRKEEEEGIKQWNGSKKGGGRKKRKKRKGLDTGEGEEEKCEERAENSKRTEKITGDVKSRKRCE